MVDNIPKLGKFISVASVVEKYKVIASIARVMLRICIKNGSLKTHASHSKQFVCSPTVAIVEKPVGEGKKDKEGKKEKDAKKEKAKPKEKTEK